MEEAVYVPEAETHMGPEAKDHQQVQAWTEEDYISEGSGDGPSDAEEEQPDLLANIAPRGLAFVLRERCSAWVMSQPEGADAFIALHKVDPVQAGHWVPEQSTPP